MERTRRLDETWNYVPLSRGLATASSVVTGGTVAATTVSTTNLSGVKLSQPMIGDTRTGCPRGIRTPSSVSISSVKVVTAIVFPYVRVRTRF